MKVTHIAGVKRTVGEGMRVERHCANALAVARYLEGVPCVKRVLYPGLESSPYHELVKTQMNGLGTGILSFELADDMSVVGPRPMILAEYDQIQARDRYGANDIRPGLTGWAQVNGRDGVTVEEKARLDGW